MTITRKSVEFAKRIFWDRLGDPYVYGGNWDPSNVATGTDCSGLVGDILDASEQGSAMPWRRSVSTESWPYDYNANRPAAPGTVGPKGTIAIAQLSDAPKDATVIINIHHGGGGEDSHTHCILDGVVMESNGDHGTCTLPGGAIDPNSTYWTDHWYLPGPIVEDGTPRTEQPMTRKGVDYAGGRIAGSALKAAGISFACRYLTDGGSALPGKQLQGAEFADLRANGIDVVFNWETTATFMLGGHDAGRADAQSALNYIHTLPGVPAGWAPVVYFSADFDEAPNQDQAIFDYCDGATEILGTEPGGRRRTGLYGAYWICKRSLDAGKVGYTWETEAWSGGNTDPRSNIYQRNGQGFLTIAGVQCDINESNSDAFGQFPAVIPASPPSTPQEPTVSNPPAIPKPTDTAGEESDVWDQLLIRWDMLNGHTFIEALAVIGQKLGITGFNPPA